MSSRRAREHLPACSDSPGRSTGVRRRRGGGDDFAEDVAEVGRDREVAALVALLAREPGPPAVDAAAADAAADHHHRVAVSVVGAAVAVLAHGPAELRHRQDDRVFHAIAEIGDERGDAAREVVEPRSRAGPAPAPWFTCVSQPPISANATSSPTSDFASCAICFSAWPNGAARIVGAVRRLVLRRVGALQHLDRVERLAAGAVRGPGRPPPRTAPRTTRRPRRSPDRRGCRTAPI